MQVITVYENGTARQIEGTIGESLHRALLAEGGEVDSPCGGNQKCGKCVVKAEGALSEMNSEERRLLGSRADSFRLACFATVLGDCSVTILPKAALKVVTDYQPCDAGGETVYSEGFGAAIDIGTTTIAAYLFSPQTKEPLASAGEYNHQQKYGADVITRIAYSKEHGVGVLCDTILHQLSDMLKGLCREAGVSAQELRTLVITGNTTMLHFYAGLYAYPIAIAPYTPASLFGDWYPSLIPEFEHASIYLPPCISAYVGADITCGALASNLAERGGNWMLIDVGTNGEMMLKARDMLACCSTAAGPAFEGAGISCGSGAVPGAIDKVTLCEDKVLYSTIGGGAAKTLCGSGLIDAAAIYLNLEAINRNGKLKEGKSLNIGDSRVTLTQMDIRQLQLAKSAIRAGIDTLLHECGIEYEHLDGILLCGGFGSYLNPCSAGTIGLIPQEWVAKTSAIGNAAGQGAAMILQSKTALKKAHQIAEKAVTVELSTNRFFLDRFMERMAFGEEILSPGRRASKTAPDRNG
ncbi:MAG: ASKHA domain-containing protein [Eubacteriales bacterium]|nr:ASKHA domain-containing protein [Eubacteriales bacterium]